jgi:hypothetical protein
VGCAVDVARESSGNGQNGGLSCSLENAFGGDPARGAKIFRRACQSTMGGNMTQLGLSIRRILLSRCGPNEVVEISLHDGRDFDTSIEAIKFHIQTPAQADADLSAVKRAALTRVRDHIQFEIDRLT